MAQEVFIQRTSAQAQRRQLAQLRIDSGTADVTFSLYSPAEGVEAVVKQIVVVGTAAGAFRIFHDEDGTTYNNTTALFWDKTVALNETLIYDTEIYLNGSSSNLAASVDPSPCCTITVYGEEIQSRAR